MKRLMIAGVAMVLASCSNTTKVEPSDIASGGDVTFAELFGIDEEQAFRDLPSSLAHCLKRAHEDFSLALKGKEPRHAKSKGALADGGTSLWEDSCYTLIMFSQLSFICENGKGLKGAIFGPELRFRSTMDRPELASIARTRFVTMETGKIEGSEFSGCAP